MLNRLFRPNISQMARDGDLSSLLRALSHRDATVRAEATTALATLPGVTDALLRALESGVPGVAEVLGQRGDLTAAPSLCALLGSPDESSHQPAAAALVQLKATGALERVLRQDGLAQARELALSALIELQPSNLAALLSLALRDPAERVRSLAAAQGARPDWSRLLDPGARLTAVQAIARQPTADDLPILLEALGDSSDAVRAWAAYALQVFPTAGQALMAATRDPSGAVRAAALRSLDVLGLRRDFFENALFDADPHVRQAAAEVLGRRKDPAALPALMAAMRGGNAEAAWALGQIGDPRASGALNEALNRADTAAAAAEALRALGSGGRSSPRP